MDKSLRRKEGKTMAKGQEAAKIVNDLLKEVNSSIDFLQTIIPCIIPNNEEDKVSLQKGLAAINQIDQAIKDCGNDLGNLDEIFNIDKIVKEYPKIKNLFSAVDGDRMGEYINSGAIYDSE